MPRSGLALVALFACLASSAVTARAETLYERECGRLELEVGPVWQTQNEVAVPGDTGTRFDLDDVTGPGPFVGGRLTVDWNPWRRHGFRLVVAPLSFTETGTLDGAVDFAGQTYAPGVRTEATYKFSTYRLTYRFWIPHNRRWHSSVGATLLVRDANIELQQGTTRSRKTDLGFVPLIHLDTEYYLSRRWSLVADLDAAWAPQGRAIDLALKARYHIDRRWDVSVGYRTIEGGADNDSVYTFSWLHQAVVAVGFTF
jgi:hypothetical protein